MTDDESNITYLHIVYLDLEIIILTFHGGQLLAFWNSLLDSVCRRKRGAINVNK